MVSDDFRLYSSGNGKPPMGNSSRMTILSSERNGSGDSMGYGLKDREDKTGSRESMQNTTIVTR